MRHTTTIFSRLRDGMCRRPIDGATEGLVFTINQLTPLTEPFVGAWLVIE